MEFSSLDLWVLAQAIVAELPEENVLWDETEIVCEVLRRLLPNDLEHWEL